MIRTILIPLTLCFASTAAVADHKLAYELVPNWLTPPEGMETIGNSHGEIDVDSKGNVYVSVEGEKSGIQVYTPDGKYSHIGGLCLKRDATAACYPTDICRCRIDP